MHTRVLVTLLLGGLLSLGQGCGNLPSSESQPALAPGIYTGVGSGTVVVRTTGSSSEESFGDMTSIQIGENGLPIVGGSELVDGDVLSVVAGGMVFVTTIRSVTPSLNGVVVQFQLLVLVDTPEGSAVLTGQGSEVYKSPEPRTIEWERSRFLSGLVNGETVSIITSETGVYTR